MLFYPSLFSRILRWQQMRMIDSQCRSTSTDDEGSDKWWWACNEISSKTSRSMIWQALEPFHRCSLSSEWQRGRSLMDSQQFTYRLSPCESDQSDIWTLVSLRRIRQQYPWHSLLFINSRWSDIYRKILSSRLYMEIPPKIEIRLECRLDTIECLVDEDEKKIIIRPQAREERAGRASWVKRGKRSHISSRSLPFAQKRRKEYKQNKEKEGERVKERKERRRRRLRRA